MIKVELNWTQNSNYSYGDRLHREMKDWCRNTWGPNKHRQPQQWRSYAETRQTLAIDALPVARLAWEYRLTFFFATQQQADWFTLRWMNARHS